MFASFSFLESSASISAKNLELQGSANQLEHYQKPKDNMLLLCNNLTNHNAIQLLDILLKKLVFPSQLVLQCEDHVDLCKPMSVRVQTHSFDAHYKLLFRKPEVCISRISQFETLTI